MLYDDIQALDPALLASRDYAAIADALSAGRVKIEPRLGGIGLVLETLGPIGGAELLDALELQSTSAPSLKWAWVLVNRGELDFGSAATRAMIDALIPEPARTLLKAVAEVPDPVTAAAVEVAMKNDDGSDK